MPYFPENRAVRFDELSQYTKDQLISLGKVNAHNPDSFNKVKLVASLEDRKGCILRLH